MKATFLILTLAAQPAAAESARLLIVNPEGAWLRLEVRDAAGKMYQPAGPGIILDRSARNRPDTKPYYTGNFVARGRAVVEVPPGDYIVIAERGLEYTRVQKRVTARAGGPTGDETRVEVAPMRWTEMKRRGWWSADFHVHRPVEDALPLVEAEDLNLAVVFTMWNKRNLWDGRPLPEDPLLRAGPAHLATVMNAEDERGGGAWMLHNLKRPLALGVEGRWFPQGKVFVEQAREQGAWFDIAWFDMEKPFWWEVPVMMALHPPDSWGVINNHFDQYGIYSGEAWGRPRDKARYPGAEGFVNYCLDLYYRYLNLGFRLPASAGSASGVLPNPVGQNRAYAYLGAGTKFDVAAYYDAMRRGRTFATNGPMLLLRLNGAMPGNTLTIAKGKPVRVEVQVSAREPIERVELIANGKVVHTSRPKAASTSHAFTHSWTREGQTWMAARCFLAPGDTVRLAHTSPVYFSGGALAVTRQGAAGGASAAAADPSGRAAGGHNEDARYFLDWMDELIAISESEKDRFKNASERDEVIGIYRRARAFYEQRARP